MKIENKNETEFSFFRFPRALIDNPNFSRISIEARTLFALILDRFYLSEINADKFSDENGDVYVIYTLEQVCEKLGCSNTRTLRCFKELEDAKMIIRKRKNRISAYRIYITDTFCELAKCEVTTSQNDNSRVYALKTHDFTKCEDIKNNISKNNYSKNNTSITGFARSEDEIREQIEYDCIVCDENKKILDELVMIICDVLNGTSPTVKIGKDDMPRGIVIARFCRLDSEHITDVIASIENNKTKIRNIKPYLISLLYNAPATAECSLTADFAYQSKGRL